MNRRNLLIFATRSTTPISGTPLIFASQSATADIGKAGPLITDLFNRMKDVPGWFTVDDCGYFFLLLSYQSAMGVKGDLLEIGTYHGRSTALMANCLQPAERIVVCDAFEFSTDDKYASKPSPEQLISNIERVNRSIERDRIVIHKCLSNDLHLDAEETSGPRLLKGPTGS